MPSSSPTTTRGRRSRRRSGPRSGPAPASARPPGSPTAVAAGEAIAEAVQLARREGRPADNTVLVLGKGHETGQEIAGVVHALTTGRLSGQPWTASSTDRKRPHDPDAPAGRRRAHERVAASLEHGRRRPRRRLGRHGLPCGGPRLAVRRAGRRARRRARLRRRGARPRCRGRAHQPGGRGPTLRRRRRRPDRVREAGARGRRPSDLPHGRRRDRLVGQDVDQGPARPRPRHRG